MVRSGRQTVSVNVDAGVLLFDKKAGSFGAERVSHDRSTTTLFVSQCLGFDNINAMTRLQWLFCCASVLQIIKFQSSPAKVHMVVDNSHNPPWEMTFESTRVGGGFPAS